MAKTLEKSRQPTKRASAPLTLESPIRQYDVCLSFAGEDRGYVEKTAKALGRLKVSVFYDRYEQSQLWGKDLYAHLDIVYRLKATFCIVFISENYAKKLWTNHERRSAQARAFLENDEYILPVRMDDAQIPGILPTVGYVDARRLTPQKSARLVSEKLETLNSNARAPKTANSEYQRILYESFDFVGFSPQSSEVSDIRCIWGAARSGRTSDMALGWRDWRGAGWRLSWAALVLVG